MTAEVAETNLAGQLFLRGCGFRCFATTHDYFLNSAAAYHFVVRLGDPIKPVPIELPAGKPGVLPVDRMSRFLREEFSQ